MSQSPNRSTFSRRVVQAVSALRSMLFRRLFRSSIYESIRPSASGRSSWLETISSLVGRGSEEIHRGGALRVSAKERAKRTAAREFRRRFVMAEQLELRALMAADLGLDPTFSQQPVSAEIGALVPGKAADAYFNVDRSDVSGVAQANLEAGVSQAAARLSSFAEGGSFAPTMQEVFGRTGIGRDAFNSAVAGLRSQWATGKLGVRVEVLSASAMNGGLGAFAADYQGAPAIFVNGDWLASNPGADAVAKVLIEEFGHSLDRRINAGIDSPGDEGELFADRVVGLTLNKDDYNRIAKENDRGFVAVSGQSVPIEFAINNGASTYTENTVLTLYTGTNSSDCNNVTGQTVIFTASNVVADDVMTFSGSWDGATPSVGTISLTQNSASSTTATGIANLTYGVAYNSTTRTATVTFTFGASFVTTGQAAAKASRDIINTARYSSGEAPGRTGALVFSLSGTAIAATLPAANSITITPRNDAPVLDTNLSPVLNPILGNLQAPSGTGPITSGTATPISALLGGYSDVDDPAGTGLRGIAITAINTTAGTLWYTLDGGQAWTTVAPISATSHLLLAENNTYLYWQPGTNTSQTVTSVLTFRGWDQSSLSTQSPGTKIDTSGASTPTPAAPDNTRAFSINTETVNVTVTQATNSAPQLADTVLSLTSINEDNPIPSGSNTTSTPVANLVGGITDANSLDGKGIAITAVNTTNGTLYYTLDNGTNWALVGSVSNTSALLLPSNGNNARLHFVPTVNFNGTADGVLTFRAWDQTSGSAGSKVSTATNGGTSAFSSATDTVSLIVNAVNDAPVATGAALLAAINEDDANPSGASVQSLFSGNFDDSFDAVTGGSSANSFAGIAIALYTVNAAQGQWQYSANGTSGWTNLAGVTARSSATVIPSGHFLRFLPAANFAGSAPTITAHLIDDSSGAVTFQTGLNITTVGSTTQYSNLTVVLSHTVTAVNDPPVRTAPATLPTISVNEDSANTTAVSLGLSALAYSNGGGTDENGQTLTYTITSIPAFVRIFKADGVSEVTASSTVSLTELQGLMYRTVANASGAGTLQWTVVDSGANTNGNSNTLTESLSMTVTAVNDAPVVYLGGGTTLNVFRQFTEGGTAVSIAPSAVISDVDSAQLQSLTITLTNAQNTGEEALNVTGNTADFTVVGNGTTTVTISGNQSLAAYATLLQSVTYSNTSANPTVNPVRTITVVARDNEAASSANSAASTASIALAAVNNPPTYNTGLPNQTATNLLPFSYQYPTNAFTDPEGDALTITAQQVVGSTASPLPSWITFNPTLRRFYGVAPAGVTSLVVRVTATDPSGGSVSQDFTITVSTLLGGNPIAAVGFATAYNLINPQDHSTSNYYQVETNSFTTASAPMAGTNFVFYQQNGVVLENGIYKFSGNNVPGKLTYINTIGEVVEVPSNNSLGIVSRPIKTPTNAVQGYYMYLDNGTPEGSTLPGGAAGNTDDTAVLLVVNPSYFSGLKQYNSSSDQVDSNLNGYLTSVGFSVSNASGNEGNGTAGTANSTPIRFVVTRDSTTATATASVQFTTSIVSGLNTASTNDFVARSGTANFAAGQLTTTIDISPVNDAVFENNETFTLTLSNPTVTDGQTVQGRLNNSTATGTILNDDSTSFSIAPSGAEEGTPPGTGNPIT
ncbi:MAG: beta strand repeat-containing protein, partial [Pirellula sp.]